MKKINKMKSLKTPTKIVIKSLLVAFLFATNITFADDILPIDNFLQAHKGEFDISVPENVTVNKTALYIILPGGIQKNEYPNFKKELVDPAVNTENTIVFSPKMSWGRANINKLEQLILEFIETAKKSYQVDDNKIVLIGYSHGALQGWKLLQSNKIDFSSFIAIASSLKIKDKVDTPSYFIQWDKDWYFPLSKAEKSVANAQKLGCNIKLVVAANNHNMNASEYMDELKTCVSKL